MWYTRENIPRTLTCECSVYLHKKYLVILGSCKYHLLSWEFGLAHKHKSYRRNMYFYIIPTYATYIIETDMSNLSLSLNILLLFVAMST